VRRGEIWDANFPEAVPEGHEQTGGRPALVINVEPDPGNPLCILMPLTSRTGTLRFPHTIRVEPSQTNGLSQPSVVMILQMRALDRRRLVKKWGVLEAETLLSVEAELKKLLGFTA
jgi:mRNA interferase MazF